MTEKTLFNWYVTIPIAGVVSVFVRDVATAKEAIAKGMENAELTFEDNGDSVIDELDIYKVLVEGNLLHPTTNRASAEKTEEG